MSTVYFSLIAQIGSGVWAYTAFYVRAKLQTLPESVGVQRAHIVARLLLLIYFDPKSSRRMYALGIEILVVRRDVSGRAERHLWRAARN